MKRTVPAVLAIALLGSAGFLWAGGAGRPHRPPPPSSITDDEIARFWGDYLVYIDEGLGPDPSRSLAERWSVSTDGLSWSFAIRKGVRFHNGEELTARDVKFTFDRLRDPEVGAATVALVQACSMVVVALYNLSNLIADILHAVLNPRTRYR